MWSNLLVELGGGDGKNSELTVLRMNFQLGPSCSVYDILARQRQPVIVDSLGRYDDVDFHQKCRGIWVCVDLVFLELELLRFRDEKMEPLLAEWVYFPQLFGLAADQVTFLPVGSDFLSPGCEYGFHSETVLLTGKKMGKR